MDLRFPWLRLFATLLLLPVNLLHAQAGAFDLAGPAVDVRVQRAGETLPISHVPNLMPGDRLWIHPQLPESQSAHYVMIVAFLRGATNPPPQSWFTKVETWNKNVHEEGVFVVVPDEAQQALIFLAPETGGDFATLRNAVRGKPGAFVRSAQDLQQASLDRLRLENYLSLLRDMTLDPVDMKERTILLARSLNIKLDHECFDKPSAQQVPCLIQNTDQLVLDDAHTETMVSRIASADSVDLAAHIAYMPLAGAGTYSPYVGAVVDLVRILASTHTAQYQYIPALALPKGDKLNLRLNNPPSFRNPKSVIVVGLPPVGPSPLPPLRAVDPKQIFCAERPDLVLPIDGAPLVFASELAHGFVLHLQTKASGSAGIDLPARVDPSRGGLMVDTRSVKPDTLNDELVGTVHAFWGFQSFEGPTFHLRSAETGEQWVVASKDASALIVGRLDTLHLQSEQAACVESVEIHDAQGVKTDVAWKTSKPDELEVRVPLENATPGSVVLVVKKYGEHHSDEIKLHTYAEAGSLEDLKLHAGDTEGILQGTRLDQVKDVEVKGVHFAPHGLTRAHQQDELKITTKDDKGAASLSAGDAVQAKVTLNDARVLVLNATISPQRPRVKIISRSVQLEPSATAITVHLGSPDELPQDAKLSFVLKAQMPETFSPQQKIEISTLDESFRVQLTVADGNLTLEDTKTVLAVLDPMRHLGPSAFGPLKMRPVGVDGTNGEWQPLADLVRLPQFRDLHCSATVPRQCTITGDKLFLLDSVSSNPAFDDAAAVPEGFVEQTLPVPTPKARTLYVRLRDDPTEVITLVWPPPTATAPPATASNAQ